MPTTLRFLSGRPGLTTGPQRDLAAEAFGARPGTRYWWQGRHRQNLAFATPEWNDRQAELPLAPIVAGQLPLVVEGGGPDGSTSVRGQSNDPAGGLITPAGTVVVPNGADWTIYCVTNDGSSATAVAYGVAGANGGGIEVRHRNSELIQVITFDAAGVATVRLSIAATAGAYHLSTLSWQQSTGTLAIWLNGAPGTPSGGVASVSGLTLLPHSQRLTALAKFDTTLGLQTASGRNVDIAMLGVERVFAPTDSAFRAALKAMVQAANNYPSLLIA
ncbi:MULTISPECIES: hypothetical protein [Roseomonadaceae]|uniref:LamG domain-containing protein n=1 Tax=Falsiroseomonas oleicola TaxID=2801474 RepID=A0ABS6HBL6_9PROT|nr:hypothetical protein [Roseomonas oleicola]MBU8545804.1 hypothetical protein [Roseomonas oleicola]